MKPGRELDAKVAEKVMGWTDIGPGRHPDELRGVPPGQQGWWWIPYYSTHVEPAWQVVERLRPDFSPVIAEAGPTMASGALKWSVEFFDRDLADEGGRAQHEVANGDTLQHAICLAALAAVEEPS